MGSNLEEAFDSRQLFQMSSILHKVTFFHLATVKVRVELVRSFRSSR
jgi:hypothetical protein